MEAVQAVPAVQEAKSTYLVPFNFQAFRTGEAVWSLDKNELIKMFRVTTKGVGEFLNPESRDPQKLIDNIIARNPHLKELGIPVTVMVTGDYKWGHSPLAVRGECPDQDEHRPVAVTGQCPTRTRQIVVNTFDIFGVYQIAIVSDLPRARIFLQEFPNLLQAFHNHTVKPPAIGDIKPEIIAFSGVPYEGRGEYRKAVCAQYGFSEGTFYRLFKEAGNVLGLKRIEFGAEAVEVFSQINAMRFGKRRQAVINELAVKLGRSPENIRELAKKITNDGCRIPRKPRAGKGESKYPGEKEKVRDFYFANLEKFTKHGKWYREMTAKVVKETLNLRAHESTINRWIRECDHETGNC